MFGPLGVWEIAFIMVLALLIFGPKKLPEVGRTIGRGMAEFRKATTDLKRTIEQEIDLEEATSPAKISRPTSALPAPRKEESAKEEPAKEEPAKEEPSEAVSEPASAAGSSSGSDDSPGVDTEIKDAAGP